MDKPKTELEALRVFAQRFDEIACDTTSRGTRAKPSMAELNELLQLCWDAQRLRRLADRNVA